jgi:hypothetical protein
MSFCAHAQMVLSEQVYGQFRNPTPEQLIVIEAYRERYRATFGEYPAGHHWIDGVKALVSLLRPDGIPDSDSPT